MRIYKNYIFNIAKKYFFKDTFEFIENLIKEMGVTNKKVLFELRDYDSPNKTNGIDKIIKKYPHFSVYRQTEPDKSYVDKVFLRNYNQLYNENDVKDLKVISQKIPRPFNVCDNEIIFYGIDWFNINQPLEEFDDKWLKTIQLPERNCIIIEKNICFGTKHNPVSVVIEVTNPSDSDNIFNDSEYFTKLSEKMGKPYRSEMHIQYSDKEQAEIAEKQKAASPITDEMKEAFKKQAFSPYRWCEKNLGFSDTYIGNSFPPMSIKKAFAPLAKKHGFKFLGGADKVYRYERLDGLNNRIYIELVQGYSSPETASCITYQSYCLRTSASLPGYMPGNQRDIENFAESVFAAVGYMESAILPKLQPIYGKSPDWYVYGK